jgi:hypothetical protein
MPSKTLKRGSRRQVWTGKAEMTAGGLRKEDLIKNPRGRIVSVKKCQTMKKTYKGSDSEDEEEPKEEPKQESKKEPKGGDQPKGGEKEPKKSGFWNTLFE